MAVKWPDCQGMPLDYLVDACLVLPMALLAIAWSRRNRAPIELSILTLSVVLYIAAFIRPLKIAFLGADYSNRLYSTIGVNMLVAILLGLYLGIKRKWIATIAAVALALAWLAVGSLNSVV
jgi:hypothetical protein